MAISDQNCNVPWVWVMTLTCLGWLLSEAGQLDAAEETGLRALNLLPENSQIWPYNAHRLLGNIYRSKGETKKAIHHLEAALGIASSLNMARQLFWIHHSLSRLFSDAGMFDEAQSHVEHTKVHARNSPYLLARVMHQQARVWDEQCMFEEAISEALRALEVFEKLGATHDAEITRQGIRHLNARKAKQCCRIHGVVTMIVSSSQQCCLPHINAPSSDRTTVLGRPYHLSLPLHPLRRPPFPAASTPSPPFISPNHT